MRKIIYLFLILSVLYIPSIIKAETEIGVLDSDISVDIYPENPEPYQDVTIKLSSYATDLNKAMIEWRVDGSNVISGYGKTQYSTKTKGPDIETLITISITPTNSIDKIIKKIQLKTSDIDVFWESIDGYTPPFYKGKSFITKESLIKVVAIPNTKTIKYSKGNISYKWQRNNNVDLNASGYNKDAYIFENDILKKNEIVNVTASAIDGSYSANKQIQIPIMQPRVIFYKKSPTEGILYNNGFDKDLYLDDGELTILAEPYYLAIKNNENYFSYNWKVNGESIETPLKKKELTIKPSSSGGYATISVLFEDINRVFQKVSGILKINL